MSDVEDAGDETSLTVTSHETVADSDDSPSDVVVRAVAALSGESPLELPPLYDSIEPDALNAMFDHARRVGGADCGVTVSFCYHGFDVTVEPDGTVRIE